MTIFDAIFEDNLELVKAHLAAGVSPNIMHPQQGHTPLMYAAYCSREVIAAYLLTLKDVDVNAGDLKGRTPLMYAALVNSPAMMALLIEEGADVAIEADNGITALKLAANSKSDEMVALLLDAGADPLYLMKDGRTALDSSIYQCDLNNTIHMVNAAGIQALYHVLKNLNQFFAQSDSADVRAYLRDISLCIRDQDGNTVLHFAAAKNYHHLIPILSQYTDINIRNNKQSTPAHLAASNNRVEALEAVRLAGGHLDLTDCYERTPCVLAILHFHAEATAYLKRVLYSESASQEVRETQSPSYTQYNPWPADDADREIDSFINTLQHRLT